MSFASFSASSSASTPSPLKVYAESTGPNTSSRTIGRVRADAGEHGGLDEVAAETVIGRHRRTRRWRPRPAPSAGSPTPSRTARPLATGPISVAGSFGSPSTDPRRPRSATSCHQLVVHRRRGRSGVTRPCRSGRWRRTRRRRGRWRRPARSASGKTICGDFPPSSSVTLLMFSAAAWATARPVAVEPVNATLSTPGMRRERGARLAGQARHHVDDAGREPGLRRSARRNPSVETPASAPTA